MDSEAAMEVFFFSSFFFLFPQTIGSNESHKHVVLNSANGKYLLFFFSPTCRFVEAY